MTITRGWSLDVPGARRRLTAILGVAVLGSALLAPGTALAAYDPATDPYSMANIAATTGATAWWNAGYTGAGVDVAVIDTGVAPVPGLDGANKIINGPDLSLESQNPAFRYLDTNGHGTFMAGLIAGNSAAYKGIAPGARIVSVKVGVADGGVDVSQVIAAIDWVVQHKTDNGLNIRVINLSYGTNSRQAAGVDPLSHAVEQAWKKGIVVVAAAGNAGVQDLIDLLANPAYNPYVIAAAGSDTKGTPSVTDDTLGAYSSHGPGNGKIPDFAAPGSHIQGLRVPNSFLDLNHSEGRLGDGYFRGSGTSEAAAMISGAAALVLQKYPTLTPDRVKKFLGSTAVVMAKVDPHDQGAGAIQLAPLLSRTPAAFTQSFTASTGKGTLDGARGTDRLTDDGVVLSGEKDIWGKAWNATAMATATAAGNTWSGGTWNGNTWSGNTWSGNTWSGNTWSGNTWSGNTWSGNTWSGNSWSGNTWSGNSWSTGSWD